MKDLLESFFQWFKPKDGGGLETGVGWSVRVTITTVLDKNGKADILSLENPHILEVFDERKQIRFIHRGGGIAASLNRGE